MAAPQLTLRFSGRKARLVREMSGLSITGLAGLCTKQGYKVHKSAISKVELGRNMPSPALLKAMVGALGCDIGDLLEDGPTAVAS